MFGSNSAPSMSKLGRCALFPDHTVFKLLRTFVAGRHYSSSSDEGSLLLKEWISDNRICRLTLNDPKKRNSLSLRMIETLKQSLKECAEREEARVVIIAAAPPIFSSGHNLKELTSETGITFHAKIFQECTEMMKLVQDIQLPVICSVKGVAAAAGCQLAASCDIVVAAENSQFSTPGVKAGLFCSTPGVAVSRAVPRKVSMDMLLTGRNISAQEALRAGLVSRVVAESEVDAESERVAEEICALSKPVIGMGKAFFYSQIETDRNTAYRLGERVIVENLRLRDCQEGISSFFEKRRPKWTHKPGNVH